MSNAVNEEGLLREEDLINEFTKNYYEKSIIYERLCKILYQDIIKLLEDSNIDIMSVDFRLKELDSCIEKIQRKKYSNPLEEIEDLSGLRIICYYTSDLDKIESIICNEFNVIESINKSEERKDSEFGYDSRHYIVTIKNEWLKTPSYRDLGDLKAEIQLRTVLMHAWADASHKFVYKNEEQVPSQFSNQLFQINAMLNNVDLQLDSLKIEREKYIEEMSRPETGMFDVNKELNLDSLQAFLDFHFPNRARSPEYLSKLFDEILFYNSEGTVPISLKILEDAFNNSEDCFLMSELINSSSMEPKVLLELKKSDYGKFKELSQKSNYYNQIGAVRTILRCYLDDYAEISDAIID